MTSDDFGTGVTGTRAITTDGSMARRRRNRIILLVALSLLLAVLAYVAYYYTQNKRTPSFSYAVAAAEKVDPLQFMYAFAGPDKNAMNKPTGIAVVGDRCYVTDYIFRTVRVYSLDGDFLFEFGGIKDGDATKMKSPVHLAAGPDDTIWVTDRVAKALYVFDGDGKFLRTFYPNGDESGKWSPLAITFDAAGDMYVTDVGDSRKHQVLVFGPDGKIKAQWGSTQQVVQSQDDQGKFYFPNGIVVKGTGPDAIVFVADGDNRRVQAFKTDGTFVRMIATSGTPRGLALDKQGRLYVVDALAHRVDIYDEKGEMLATFGEQGRAPGQFSFPNDIAFDSRGRAFITDRNNDQVQVWGLPVAEIPGITKVTPGTAWIPFTLLSLAGLAGLAAARRKKRFVAMPDFVESMADSGALAAMDNKKFQWVDLPESQSRYEGRVIGGVNLGDVISGEPHSDTEARAIRDRLGVSMEQASILALAKWARFLCTQDVELARSAVRLGIDVYDCDTWLNRYAKRTY